MGCLLSIQFQWLAATPPDYSQQQASDVPAWSLHTTIELPPQLTGVVRVAAAAWSANYYLLDELLLQIIAVSPRGEILHKYGGWGTGTLALDLPVQLDAVENSVFVLDQGQRQILCLDAMLNPVSVTPLPNDRLPLSFCRDVQRRFWVIYEDQGGIFVYDEIGGPIDRIADRTDGLAPVLHPSLIACTVNMVAVWDSIEDMLYLFSLSGQFMGKQSLPGVPSLVAMIWAGEQLLLATSDQLLALKPLQTAVTSIADPQNLIDLSIRSRNIIGLDPSGVLHVFRPLP